MEGTIIMSDAIWDMEYDMAFDSRCQIQDYCDKNNIQMPSEVNIYTRSWDLEKIFEKLKDSNTR